MTTISKISIKNFLSIGNITQEVNLAVQGLTLILGENVDIGGGNSRNGVGKSTILQAISYGLYGEPLTKIRLDNLVNNINNKTMLVKIELESEGKKYIIERGRKPNLLRLFVNGVEKKDNEAQGENKHTQTEIERIIGMSHIMFKNVVALNTFTEPFMRLKAADQREIIEELLGITQLSQRASSLKELMDQTKDLLRTEEATIKANNEANTRIEQAIDRARTDVEVWKIAQDRQTNILVEKAEQLNLIDIDAEISIFDQIDAWNQQKKEVDDLTTYAKQEIETCSVETSRLKKEMSRYEDEAARVDNGEISRLEAQMRRYISESEVDISIQINRLITEVSRKRKEATARIDHAETLAVEFSSLQEQIENPNAHTCTTCGQGLVGTNHLEKVMARLTSQHKELSYKIEKAMVDSDTYNDEADGIEKEITQTTEALTVQKEEAAIKAKSIKQDIEVARTVLQTAKETAANRVLELREMLDKINEKLLENKSVVEEGNQVLEAIGSKPTSKYPNRESIWKLQQDREVLLNQIESEMTKENPHLSKIEGLQSTLVVIDYDPINEYNIRLKHEAFLLKLLTAKDSFIRKKIVDQNLSYLNKRMNHYLDKIGLPHEVSFKPDLTVEVNLLGRDLDFEQLSRGEMNRVILATFWSFRDVYENLNKPFNLIFIDELLDNGLDGIGAEAAVVILQGIARDRKKNVFLISHKENLIDKADRVMLVRKENHFTTIDADYELV